MCSRFQFYYLKWPFRKKGDSVKSGTISLKGWVLGFSSPISCLQCPKHLLGFSETWKALAAESEEMVCVLVLQQNRGLSGSKHSSSTCAHPLFSAEDSEGNKEANMPQRQSCCEHGYSLAHVAFLLPGNFKSRRAPVNFQILVGVGCAPSLSKHCMLT